MNLTESLQSVFLKETKDNFLLLGLEWRSHRMPEDTLEADGGESFGCGLHPLSLTHAGNDNARDFCRVISVIAFSLQNTAAIWRGPPVWLQMAIKKRGWMSITALFCRSTSLTHYIYTDIDIFFYYYYLHCCLRGWTVLTPLLCLCNVYTDGVVHQKRNRLILNWLCKEGLQSHDLQGQSG